MPSTTNAVASIAAVARVAKSCSIAFRDLSSVSLFPLEVFFSGPPFPEAHHAAAVGPNQRLFPDVDALRRLHGRPQAAGFVAAGAATFRRFPQSVPGHGKYILYFTIAVRVTIPILFPSFFPLVRQEAGRLGGWEAMKPGSMEAEDLLVSILTPSMLSAVSLRTATKRRRTSSKIPYPSLLAPRLLASQLLRFPAYQLTSYLCSPPPRFPAFWPPSLPHPPTSSSRLMRAIWPSSAKL